MRALSERHAIGEDLATAFIPARLRTERKVRRAAQKTKQAVNDQGAMDLEIARKARHRAAVEQQAAAVAQDKCDALERAAAAFREKLSALESVKLERVKRKASLIALQAAARRDRSLRWQVFIQKWLVLSPVKAAACAVAIGLLLGFIYGRPGVLASISVMSEASAQEQSPDDQNRPFAYEDEIGVIPRLKLDRNLMPH